MTVARVVARGVNLLLMLFGIACLLHKFGPS
ncbi:hypothetical protein Gotur_000636 [Gossypium turneri]